MADYLEYTLDKFTFKVATDCLYSPAGVWVRAEGGQITVGVSDFVGQRSGDVAFADVAPVGTAVVAGQELANLETIKVDLELPAPVSGLVTAVNEALEMEAEVVNLDPYGRGWLAIIEASDWPAERAGLLSPEAYLAQMEREALEDLGS
ncbi:MAG: glycine cleavage system protein H [Chloroflexota bacterium]|jgi:glycine cleavage system H protein